MKSWPPLPVGGAPRGRIMMRIGGRAWGEEGRVARRARRAVSEGRVGVRPPRAGGQLVMAAG